MKLKDFRLLAMHGGCMAAIIASAPGNLNTKVRAAFHGIDPDLINAETGSIVKDPAGNEFVVQPDKTLKPKGE